MIEVAPTGAGCKSMKRPLPNFFYWLGVTFATLICVFVLSAVGIALYIPPMIEAEMADWYVNESAHFEFGSALYRGHHYRLVVGQRLGPDCVKLGAHRYRNGSYEDEPEHVMAYPRKCS
jgi:hypothetical protein